MNIKGMEYENVCIFVWSRDELMKTEKSLLFLRVLKATNISNN
jgi:hypothetical protein